jgi:hypothetical protein
MKQKITKLITAIKMVIAVIIGVSYSMLLLVTFLVATQAIVDILDWARTEIRGTL